jgi:hypothetical protein
MKKYNDKLNTSGVNAVLRRMNFDEDFKIEFREFSIYLTPVLQGFDDRACLTRKEDLNLPDKNSNDILRLSKYLSLLEHEGPGFRIEEKKQVLRNMKLTQKQSFSNNGKAVMEKSCAVRGFRQVHAGQAAYKSYKKAFDQMALKSKINKNDQYLVDLRDM